MTAVVIHCREEERRELERRYDGRRGDYRDRRDDRRGDRRRRYCSVCCIQKSKKLPCRDSNPGRRGENPLS